MARTKVSKSRLRLQRQATAYARVASKAERAGQWRVAEHWRKVEANIRARAERA